MEAGNSMSMWFCGISWETIVKDAACIKEHVKGKSKVQ
jgi:hypothetical protein